MAYLVDKIGFRSIIPTWNKDYVINVTYNVDLLCKC